MNIAQAPVQSEATRHGPIRIGRHRIANGAPAFIVAEIGINHNGDMELARRSIEAAAAAGADSVKFQNYRTEDFISDRSLTYTYRSRGQTVTEPQYDMFKRCEFGREQFAELKAHCDRCDVVFHSTPTSEATLSDLVELGAPVLKNGSDLLQHLPLIAAMGRSGLPTVISTGMANEAEIGEAVRTFRATGNEQLILLHCTSSYPTPPAEVNLARLPALAARFDCLVGFSDHTEGVEAAAGAVLLGACWIEKHFTLDRNLPGPDHWFSSDEPEFRELVRAIRRSEEMRGSSRIEPAASELKGRQEYRLSCVAASDLPAGHCLQTHDIAFRRPGTGLPPAEASALVGKRLRRTIARGAPFALGDFG
jgi:N-acetylneuraminate synthase/N,N'-diacetyllegionaminate synthase